LYKPAKHK